jgi:hypothetical protein
MLRCSILCPPGIIRRFSPIDNLANQYTRTRSLMQEMKGGISLKDDVFLSLKDSAE